MKLPKRCRLAAAALALTLCAGCGSAPPSQQIESIAQNAAPSAAAPVQSEGGGFSAPEPLTATFDEAAAQTDNDVLWDTSHLAQGYVAVRTSQPGKIKFLLTYQGDTGGAPSQYSYLMPADGSPAIIPLQLGSGDYELAVCQNISGDKYAYLSRQTVTAALEDDFAPFLRPSIYIPYTPDSACVAKASELTAGAADTVDAVGRIYDYIVTNIDYDTPKAESIGTDYYPDPDETLATGKGICVDYAALAAAMLRSQGIPTKLITGYVAPNDLYHAWNMIWLEETGWITVEFEVKPGVWNRVDTTFAAGGAGSQYIGDGSNYTDFRTY